MDIKHSWRRRRIFPENESPFRLPTWIVIHFRRRSSKMRSRLILSTTACILVVYLLFSTYSTPGKDVPSAQVDAHPYNGNSKSNSYKGKWKEKSSTHQDKARKAPGSRLMAPDIEGVILPGRRAPPGFMGVGGDMDLKPPPGPILQLEKPPGYSDHLNPRMKIVDSSNQIKGIEKKVGPPGQSNAMHIMEGDVFPLVDPIKEGDTHVLKAIQGMHKQKSNDISRIIVHLDLRVGPPKVSYLEEILPLLKRLGATGLLISYEDNFPFVGELSTLVSNNPYSRKDIHRLVTQAKLQNLEIIPVTNIYSNSEFLLKHAAFKYLQEKPGYMQNINPAKNATLKLMREIIAQVLKLHPGVKYLHIGCEEIFHLGLSKETKTLMEKQRKTTVDIFLEYIVAITSWVKSSYPHIQVLMWDNILKSIPGPVLKKSQIGNLIQPVISLKKIEFKLRAKTILKYANVFPSLWLTSLFNRPEGNIGLATQPVIYVKHQHEVLKLVSDIQNKIKISGIFLYGAYKTNHFSPVGAVILPVALPTLAICLKTLNPSETNEHVMHDIMSVMQCPSYGPTVLNEDQPWGFFSTCNYPGNTIYRDFVAIQGNVMKMQEIIKSERRSDVSPIVRSFEELLPNLPSHLVSIYNPHFAREWIEGHVINNLSPLGGFKTKVRSMIHKSKLLSPVKGPNSNN